MKRVAIQNGLEGLKEKLEKLGYEVVCFTAGGYVDAIIYTDDYRGIESVNNQDNMNSSGAILINANNKTIEQIQYIIENRRYEGLFM